MEDIEIGNIPKSYNNRRRLSGRRAIKKNAVSGVSTVTRRKEERRKTGKISEKTLNFFISHIRDEQTELIQHLKEKEDKKLVLVKYIFSILPVFATVATVAFSYMIFIFKEKLDIDPAFIVIMFNMLIVIMLGGISTISIALIKYLSSLKTDSIIALRQINCNRQALYSALFAKVEGRYPRYPELDVNSNDRYSMLYGSHRKFPIDNMDFRKSYSEPSQFWMFSVLKWIFMAGNFLFIFRPLVRRFPMSDMIMENRVPRVFHVSSDFFSMLSIAFLTMLLMPLPLVGNMLLADLSKGDEYQVSLMLGPWITLNEIEISWLVGASITIIAMYIYLGFIVSTFKNTYKIIHAALASDKEYK